MEKVPPKNEAGNSNLEREASRQSSSSEAPLVDAPGPTTLAKRVSSLKKSTLAAGEKHSRLPQTLFWSLFHSEVNEIKRKKARRKLLNALK